MDHFPWEADGSSDDQEITLLSWKPKEHYHVHNSPSLFSLTLVHVISFRSVLILSSHARLGLQIGIFILHIPTKILNAFLISAVREAFLAHLIFLNLIVLIILKRNKLSRP
jgi:hypothetical protein